MGNSLNKENIKSFLDFNSVILGKPFNNQKAISLITYVVTIADRVKRRFKLSKALALRGPVKVKLYKCFIDDKTLLI